MAGGDPGHNYEYGINKIYNPPLSILDNITFYSTYFAIPGTQHDNFVSSHEKFGPILVSLENCQGDRRALIWTKKGIRRINVPGYEYNTVEQACNYLLEKLFGTTKDIPLLKLKDNIVSDLVELEKQCFFVNYKFGVLLARPGKISEDEMYDNSEMSPDFEEFLSFLGDKIALKGWKGFRGGLDVELDKTGEYSYYTMFDSDIQIMFHVCPLIPYIPDDPSRKRYIGNDVVVIIFKEGENDVFNPAIMRSQFNYVFLVVEKVPQTEGTTKYRIQFCSRPGVPPFPPYLNDPPVFEKTPEFRQFLLTKLINGERATISSAKDFAQKMDRTRNQLLETLIEKYKAPKKKK
uniref:Rap-GAP domain-containing protein n=1 Tax=Arcella intermedia TaxID=1963864 RepID=A0A6B2L8X5_9EUKA